MYARAFDLVEVDSTFYAHPPPERLESWRDRTPDGFTFTLKMPGEVTHELGLSDPRPAVRFCEDVRLLGPKLGGVLVQLPPHHGPARFAATAAFLDALPDDVPAFVEFRDRAWLVEETFAMLRDAGVGLALSTGPWLGEAPARSIADGVDGAVLYLRWLGRPLARSEASLADRDREIDAWAERLQALAVEQVYAFFNNDYQGHSPASARRLQRTLGQAPVPPVELSPQTELFG